MDTETVRDMDRNTYRDAGTGHGHDYKAFK
jgi:hypothetical protein